MNHNILSMNRKITIGWKQSYFEQIDLVAKLIDMLFWSANRSDSLLHLTDPFQQTGQIILTQVELFDDRLLHNLKFVMKNLKIFVKHIVWFREGTKCMKAVRDMR